MPSGAAACLLGYQKSLYLLALGLIRSPFVHWVAQLDSLPPFKRAVHFVRSDGRRREGQGSGSIIPHFGRSRRRPFSLLIAEPIADFQQKAHGLR